MIDIKTVYRETEKSSALSALATGLLVAVTDNRDCFVKVSLTVSVRRSAGRTDMKVNQHVLRFRRLG